MTLEPLLTPEEVAGLLKVSLRTVHKYAARWSGFYPAGLRALRFKPEIIHDLLGGKGERVALSVPASRPEIREGILEDQTGGRRCRSGASQIAPGPGASNHTDTDFRTIANEFLDFCKRRFVEKTYKEKAFVYKSFRDFAGNLPVAQITPRDVLAYLATRPSNPNYNKHRKNSCAFFQWAFKLGFIPQNPCLYVGTMPTEKTRKLIPTQEEVVKMFLAAGELRPFFLSLYSLAARVGEINRLRWEDVNFERRQATLWTRKGRTGEIRAQVKAVNDDLYKELQRLYGARAGEWVFPNPQTGLPFVNRRKQLTRICADAGVPNLGFHAIRHHVASLLADSYKESLPTIQKMLGHQRLSTTERYVQSITVDLRGAADKLTLKNVPTNVPTKSEQNL